MKISSQEREELIDHADDLPEEAVESRTNRRRGSRDRPHPGRDTED